MPQEIGIGVIGMGWMGDVHSRAYRQVSDRFPEINAYPRLICCADPVEERASMGKQRHGFAKYSTDWRSILEDNEISVVSVTASNDVHEEIVCSAVAAGKHVHCEKPVGKTPQATAAIYNAAQQTGVLNFVGFNYRWAPMVQYAKKIIAEGKIGKITHFRSRYFEGYARNQQMPFSWRFDETISGTGVVNDMLSHTTDLAHFLIDNIARVVASRETWIKNRSIVTASSDKDVEMITKAVTNEDYAGGMMQFANGAYGTFEASRVITGPQQELKFEIHGTDGSLIWDMEKMNELQVHYNPDREAIREGYTRLFSNPDYPIHRHFNEGQGTGLGYEDLKTIEISQFLDSVVKSQQASPGFKDALAVAEVHNAIAHSWESGSWEEIKPLTK